VTRAAGTPLTEEEVAVLAADTEVEVTWSGGNGPHRYRIWIDRDGMRCVDNIYHDPLDFIGPEQPYTVVRLIA
jgi:hypothetical protein